MTIEYKPVTRFLPAAWQRQISRIPGRLGWWLCADARAVFRGFSWHPDERCVHVNRTGIRCFRSWVYDRYCGLHNSICKHESVFHYASATPEAGKRP